MARFVILIFLATQLYACASITSVEPFSKESKLGIVLMHGKNGNPNSFIGGLAGSLSSAGAIVETPEMPWSHLRRYDVDFETAMKEIDEAVATLRSKGARRIIVAGHSMGALGAVGYAARYEGLSGVIGIAPGHAASGGFQKHIGDDDFIKARKMVARGEGNSYSYFDDWNNNVGGQVSLHTTANVYISYFDPDGPGTYAKNIPNMKPGYPTLVVYGDRDNTAYAFNGTSHPKSDVIVIPSTHLGAPSDGVDVIASWLRSLECKKPWCGNPPPKFVTYGPDGWGRLNCTLEEIIASKNEC